MTPVAFSILDIINTTAQVASLIVVLAAAVAAIVQLRHLRASNELEALLTLTEQLRDPEMQKAFRYVQTELDRHLEDVSYRGELAHLGYIAADAHPEVEVCNWFNEVGALVKNRLVDEGTFLDLFARLVTYYWSRLEVVVAIMRRERGAGQYENFEYLAYLALAWKTRHPSGAYPRNVPRLPSEDRWATVDAVTSEAP
jgi:hypothetical protein